MIIEACPNTNNLDLFKIFDFWIVFDVLLLFRLIKQGLR